MKIIRTIFQDAKYGNNSSKEAPKFIIVLDMEDQSMLSTADIPNLPDKMEAALPGIFPNENSKFIHSCGGYGTGIEAHSFREELERGTDIPHLLEHVLLHLLSRRLNSCSGYCGQRSADIERGISTHYYLVMDYPSKIEAIVAVDLGFQLINAWIEGRTITIDPASLISGIREIIEPMVNHAA